MQSQETEPETEPTPEEIQARHLSEIVLNMTKAEQLAQYFREKTIGKPFTMMSLANILRQNPQEVEKQFNSLLPYGFLNIVKRHGGIPVFQIVMDKKKRMASFDHLIDQYNHQIVYLQNVKELIAQQMVAEETLTPKHQVN